MQLVKLYPPTRSFVSFLLVSFLLDKMSNTPTNLTIYSSTKFVCGEFEPKTIEKFAPNVKKVIYYICSWHFHSLPKTDEFAKAGIECEIIDLPHYDTESLIKTIKETSYSIPTLIIVQNILPFQREAWNV
jgi:hypothetical protein